MGLESRFDLRRKRFQNTDGRKRPLQSDVLWPWHSFTRASSCWHQTTWCLPCYCRMIDACIVLWFALPCCLNHVFHMLETRVWLPKTPWRFNSQLRWDTALKALQKCIVFMEENLSGFKSAVWLWDFLYRGGRKHLIPFHTLLHPQWYLTPDATSTLLPSHSKLLNLWLV